METIIDIVAGMRQSEFISAINNNFKYMNMGASLQTIDASGTPAKINSNFTNLNGVVPFPDSMVTVENGMISSDYINAIQGNFTKIKAAQTLKNVGPKLIIRFDDGYASQYTGWYPLLESLGVKGNIAALATHYATNHSGLTTDNNYFSWSRAIEMKNDGWDIDFHGLIYTDYYTSSIAYIESIFDQGVNEFLNHGLIPNHYHVHSSNNYNPKTIALQLAARRYFKTANLWINTPYNLGNADLFNLGLLGFDGATDPDYNISFQTGIDNFHTIFLSMVGTDRFCVIAGHAYSTELANGMTAIINDAKSLGIEIVTMTEFYNGLVKV